MTGTNAGISSLGLSPRLALALLPWLLGEAIDAVFFGCFFSESLLCIYYFHPPGMDVTFALLVLAPFLATRKLIVLRILALIALSILVHALSVSILIDTRGSLELPGFDSIFLNVIPVAIGASVVAILTAALLCGLPVSWRLGAYAAMAGLPVAFTFLLTELLWNTSPIFLSTNWHWTVWHLSICIAMYFGREFNARNPA